MILDLNEPDENYLITGNSEDVCILCADEYSKKEKCSLGRADKALRGSFDGKRIMKLPLNSFRATVCLDHIKRIAEAAEKQKERNL